MLKRVVMAVEVFALVAFVFWGVMLFANEPEAAGDLTEEQAQGMELFAANCARCHGGDATGGVGPNIAGYNSERAFPDIADQVALVQSGRGGMPAFADSLSEAEIAAVVTYLRDVLVE